MDACIAENLFSAYERISSRVVRTIKINGNRKEISAGLKKMLKLYIMFGEDIQEKCKETTRLYKNLVFLDDEEKTSDDISICKLQFINGTNIWLNCSDCMDVSLNRDYIQMLKDSPEPHIETESKHKICMEQLEGIRNTFFNLSHNKITDLAIYQLELNRKISARNKELVQSLIKHISDEQFAQQLQENEDEQLAQRLQDTENRKYRLKEAETNNGPRDAQSCDYKSAASSDLINVIIERYVRERNDEQSVLPRISGSEVPASDERSNAENIEENKCPICFSSFTNPTTLACAHSFCLNCIRTAIIAKRECPVCRNPISSDWVNIINVLL